MGSQWNSGAVTHFRLELDRSRPILLMLRQFPFVPGSVLRMANISSEKIAVFARSEEVSLGTARGAPHPILPRGGGGIIIFDQ